MCKYKFALIFSLVVLLALPITLVSADEMPKENLNDRLVTEYNAPDLTDPIIIDATETIAPIGTELDIAAKSCILMDVATGTILYEKNSHEALAPASITKVMALLLTMEAIESGQFSTDTVLSASEHACSMGGSQIWLEPGEQMSVHDLLKAAVVGSANDATVVLGEAIAGSEESFVALMNERAKELGLNDTNFVNATGLDADGHLTSAHDIAVMSKELIKHDLIKEYSTIWMDSLRNGESELVNTNKLVRFYEGCTGLKTGTTSKAGACLSATAKKQGMELVAVVMGAATSNDRFNGARKLLDYGFANWTTVNVCPQTDDLAPISVKNGDKDKVILSASEQKILIEKNKAKSIELVTELPEILKAPIAKGQQVGITRIMVENEEIGNVKIVAAEEICRMTFLKAFLMVLKNYFFM